MNRRRAWTIGEAHRRQAWLVGRWRVAQPAGDDLRRGPGMLARDVD